MKIPPFIPLVWSVVSILAILFLYKLNSLIIFVFGIILLSLWCQRNLQVVFLSLKMTIPFAIPLIVIHGVINPTFNADFMLFDIITLRYDGAIYALKICIKIYILTIAVVTWKIVDTKRLLLEAIAIKIPLQLVVMIAVSISTLRTVSLRIQTVYLAQQARGIPAGPGFRAKLMAAPAVVLPVITSTLIECVNRGNVLANRGLGATPIYIFNTYRLSKKEIIIALSIILPFCIAFLSI